MTSKSTDTAVLICGAGPTGLLAACQLARFGIPFRIIDKKAGPTKESRALGIQARTMEIFRQMGLVEQFLVAGNPTNAINVWLGEKKRRIPLGNAGKGLTEFPYLFILEQSKTETILGHDLKERGHSIEWDTKLVSLTQNETSATAILEKNGKQQEVHARYVIAADGAHSFIRHTLQTPFEGGAYKQMFFVLDCVVSGLSQHDEIYLSLAKSSFTGLFPMSNGRCRVIATVDATLAQKETLRFDDVVGNLENEFPIPIKVTDPEWISFYHSSHRSVATFRSGRIFLAGDAAHIHSPAGAQGMNTGIQDVYNLVWKLAYTIDGHSPKQLLDTYNAERLPFAKSLVRTTDRVFSFVVDERPLLLFIRLSLVPHILSILSKSGIIKQLIFPKIAQLGINYRDSMEFDLTNYGRFDPDAPRPGDRLPYALFGSVDHKQSLQHYVDGTLFHVFVFSKRLEDAFAKKVRHAIKNRNCKVHYVLFNKRTKKLYETYGIQDRGFYLVRPDMYIAYRSNGLKKKHLHRFLGTLFG